MLNDISGWITADIIGWDTFGWMQGIHKFMTASDGHPPFKWSIR